LQGQRNGSGRRLPEPICFAMKYPLGAEKEGIPLKKKLKKSRFYFKPVLV
jgi:hypothetical protein